MADEHEAFLGTIFKRPEDVTARLVYADWLDEHDHPGGECGASTRLFSWAPGTWTAGKRSSRLKRCGSTQFEYTDLSTI